jgi:hypothetical protein
LVGVEQWAELRREHFVRGVSIKDLVRRTGLSRNTIRVALRAPAPPGYRREPAGSKLDAFKGEIHVLLGREPQLTGQRVRELIASLGFVGGKTIVDDYLREIRPFFVDARTYQRTVYGLTLELLGIRRGLGHRQTSFPANQMGQPSGVHGSGGTPHHWGLRSATTRAVHDLDAVSCRRPQQ